jgi:hypothetical protein
MQYLGHDSGRGLAVPLHHRRHKLLMKAQNLLHDLAALALGMLLAGKMGLGWKGICQQVYHTFLSRDNLCRATRCRSKRTTYEYATGP